MPSTVTIPVTRRRLLGPVAERFRRRVTVIEAGAGFGKTTLLRQALVEAADHGIGIDVLVTVPRAGVDAAGLLDRLATAFERSGTVVDVTDVRTVADAVWGHAPGQCCVVVDDAHWLEPDAVAAVLELVDLLPVNGHVLVASRPAPQGLARRLLDAELLRLDESDLAFDHDEQAAFASSRGSLLDLDRLSGWPAMLELELRSGRTGALDYLVSEVLSSLQTERLETCRRLAVFTRIDDLIVAEMAGLSGRGSAGSTTAVEATAGLPLVTVDADGTVELHDLVRDALHAGWPEADATRAAADGARVAERLGHLDVAITLFERAGESDAVRAIARRLAGDLHVGTTPERRRSTVSLLRRVLGNSIDVDVAEAVGLAVESPVRALGMLQSALGRALAADDTELEALCRLRLADHAYNAADAERLLVEIEALDALACAGVAAAQRTIFLPHVWLRSITDRHADVVSYLDEYRSGVAGGDPEVEQLTALYRVLNLAHSGHVTAALEDAEALARLPSGLFANRLGAFRTLQLWTLGRLDAEARRDAERLVDRIHDAGQFHLFVESAATLALIDASAGEIDRAVALVERAERELDRLSPTAWARHTVAQARAVLALLDGDEPAAATILTDAIPPGGVATLPRFIYGVTAALSYVLVPSTRATWDADDCGPDHIVRRDVGRALVALRERGDTAPAGMLPWDDVGVMRTWAFEPHLAELALAAIDAGARGAEQLLGLLRLDTRGVLGSIGTTGPPVIRRRAQQFVTVLPRRPPEPLEIGVLGPVELRRNGRPIVDDAWSRRQRVRDLLLLLVEHRRIDRARLIDILWPDKSTAAGSSNLRFTLSQLHGVLEPWRSSSDATWFVRTEGSQLVLFEGELLHLDVDDFNDRCAAARTADLAGRPARALDEYVQACSRYRGEYLGGASDPGWGFYRGLQLRGRFVEAAVRAAELLLGLGELDRAEELVIRAAAAEPVNEVSHRTLAEVLLARRRPGAARDVVEALLAELDGLGVTPEPGTRRLARRLGLLAG